jgi:putative flippase GtrA
MSSESIIHKNTEPPVNFLNSLWARPGVRQLIKFCVVGTSSAVIDFGLFNLLSILKFSVILAITIPFFCAVANGFYWNRRWTFGAVQGDVKAQYSKFVISNSIGWTLNVTAMTSILVLAEHFGYLKTNLSISEIIHAIIVKESPFSLLVLNAAKVVATLCVMAWNFTAARLWTFKK